MAYWLLKTEPDVYSIDDLKRDKSTVWDGVSNNAALKNIRAMQRGDECLIYHTGDERAAVGIAKVTKGPHADPAKDDEKLVVVDVKFVKKFAAPVTLAMVKAEERFADWNLVRQARLSVVPTSEEQWNWVVEQAK